VPGTFRELLASMTRFKQWKLSAWRNPILILAGAFALGLAISLSA
jgi:hypothetical protein